MRHADAFLQDILENPDDDAPRLIFADWLAEQDDPQLVARGEFIRVQFALRDLPADDPRRPFLEERQRDLLAVYEPAWTAPLRELGLPGGWLFRRGFVAGLALSPQQFLSVADTLFRLAPVQELTLMGGENDTRRYRLFRPQTEHEAIRLLANRKELSRLTTLAMDHPNVTGWEIIALVSSPHFTRLRTLRLGGTGWADPGARRALLDAPFLENLTTLLVHITLPGSLVDLLNSPRLEKLTHLDLSGIALGIDDWQALARSPVRHALQTLRLAQTFAHGVGLKAIAAVRWPALRLLDLRETGLVFDSVSTLTDSSLLETVETLLLGTNHLGDRGVEHLALSPRLPRLRALDLSANRLGPASARALASSEHLHHLEFLNLRTNRLGDDGLRALAQGPGLRGLRSLRVSYNGITAAGVRDLAASPPPALATLDLSWNALGDPAARALAAAPGLRLTALDLSYAGLGDAAAEALAGAAHLSGLAVLHLGTNRIGAAGAAALADAPHLGRLEALDLGYNAIGADGARALAGSPLCARLSALNVVGNGIPAEQGQALRGGFRGHLGA